MNTNDSSKHKVKIKEILSVDERMRVIANLMIDRIFEDYKNGSLKFKNKCINVESRP